MPLLRLIAFSSIWPPELTSIVISNDSFLKVILNTPSAVTAGMVNWLLINCDLTSEPWYISVAIS